MTTEGIVLLRWLAEWRSLPRAEREMNEALVVCAAETHLRAGLMEKTYSAWWDVISLSAPLPIPFVAFRGQA